MRTRAGIFTLASDVVRANPEAVAEALADMRFLPVEVEYNPMSGQLTYTGHSKRFDELPFGDEIPEYYVMITEVNGGFDSVKVERVKS